MNSVVVHYKELALKGRTGPGSSSCSCGTSARPLTDLDVRRVRPSWAGSRSSSARAPTGTTVRERLRTRVRHRELLARRPRAARSRDARRTRSSPTSATVQPRVVPRVARAGRTSGIPFTVAADRARGRRAHQGGARAGTSNLERSGADHPRRDAARTTRSTSSARSRAPAACRPAPAGGVACLLSGGIDSPVAAYRMMRRGCRVQLDPLPQLSDPVARVAGEGARDRRAADALPAARRGSMLVPFGELQQQVVLAVPPELRVVIYRRLMLRIAERLAAGMARARAGHRRGRRPGGVADAREPDDHRRRRRRCQMLRPLVGMDKDEITAEAQRIGTLPHLDHSRPGLLHAVHAAPPGHARAPSRRSMRAEAALPIDEMVDTAVRGAVGGGLQVPGAYESRGCEFELQARGDFMVFESVEADRRGGQAGRDARDRSR